MASTFYYKHIMILRYLRGKQLSVPEFEILTGHEKASLSKRFSELHKWNLIRIVESKRVGSRKCRVYSLSDFGYTYITELYHYGKV